MAATVRPQALLVQLLLPALLLLSSAHVVSGLWDTWLYPLFDAVWLTEAAEKYDARCLDGTPGLYYFRPGTGTGMDKFVIYHEGGGWCYDSESCYKRAVTYFGTGDNQTCWSAADMEAVMHRNQFSSSPAKNPVMYNWNHVYIHYCDGTSFMGNKKEPTEYNNGTHTVQLWHAGHRIHEAMMQDLIDNRGLLEAKEIVLAGSSAGGLAVILKIDSIRAKLNPSTRVVGLSDAGFFIDVDREPCNYATHMLELYYTHETRDAINQACVSHYEALGEDPAKCMYARETFPFIRTPLFLVQSKFDGWQASQVFCRADDDAKGTNEDGALMVATIEKTLRSAPAEVHHGMVIDGCFHHSIVYGHLSSFESVTITFDAWDTIPCPDSQLSLAHAFKSWYTEIGDELSRTLPNTRLRRAEVMSEVIGGEEGVRWWEVSKQQYPCDECCGSLLNK